MNEFEREDARRIGSVIRAARKLRGLSQSEVSRELQISQVTLSSIENGQVAISGSLWYRLSGLLKVSPDHTFFKGIIDSGDVNDLNDPADCGFSIPKRYTKNAFSTIRTSQPFFKYFECCYGRKALEEFLKERLSVDPDIRLVYNLRLSIRFNLDIAAYLIRAGHLKVNNLGAVTQAILNPKTHGALAHYYEGARDPIDLIKTLFRHISLYESNFSYTIVDEPRRGLEILSVPADFMRYFSYKEDELPGFINQYRLSFLRTFSKYARQVQPVQIGLIPSASKRKTECLFKISI